MKFSNETKTAMKIFGAACGTVAGILGVYLGARFYENAMGANEEACRKTVWHERTKEIEDSLAANRSKIEEAQDLLDKYKLEKEAYIGSAVTEYCNTNDILNKRAHLKDELDKAISDWDIDNDFEGAKKEIKDSCSLRIEAAKKTLNYDAEKEKLQKSLRSAKDDKKRVESVMTLLGDGKEDYSKTLDELSKEKIDSIKESLDDLDEKLKDAISAEKKEMNLKLAELETKRKQFVDKQKDIYRNQKAELDAGVNRTKITAQNEFENSHKGYENELQTQLDTANNFIQARKELELSRVHDLMGQSSKAEIFGRYLKESGCKKITVIGISAIPVVLIGILLERYARFISNVLKAMN